METPVLDMLLNEGYVHFDYYVMRQDEFDALVNEVKDIPNIELLVKSEPFATERAYGVKIGYRISTVDLHALND